jgi:hypothetical protein
MLEAWLAYFSIALAFLVYDLAANEKILAVGRLQVGLPDLQGAITDGGRQQ